MTDKVILKFEDSAHLPGIYLERNGGISYVKAFLSVAKTLNFTTDNFGIARLCQVIGMFMKGRLGMAFCNRAHGFDDIDGTGAMYVGKVYIIKDFDIIGREGLTFKEENENPKQTKQITEFILDLYNKLEESRVELQKNQKGD